MKYVRMLPMCEFSLQLGLNLRTEKVIIKVKSCLA